MKKSFPPPGFIQTESAVSGIVVYKPQPKEAEHQEVVDFRCPNCDGVTAYNTDDGGLTCTYCGYHEAPQSEVVGKQAEEFEFTVETMHRAVHGWGEERKELVCQSCAAHTTLPVSMLTHTCPFCGSNKVVQAKAPQDVLRPRFLVPFSVTTETCRHVLTEWLGNNWMLPKELNRLGRGTEFTPIYIPFWTFDSRAQARWRAEVAKTVRRGKETKTVWRWEKGNVNLFFDDLLVPGTTKLSDVLLRRVRKYSLDDLVPYEPSYLAGIQAQAYDVTLDDGWTTVRQRMRKRTKTACQERATSKKMRNFSMSLNFSDESWRYILLPMYLATFHYGEQSYQVLINGQSGKIAGQRPVDWRKVGLAILAMLAPALLLGLVGTILLLVGTAVPDSIPFFAIIFFIFGAIFGAQTFQKAQKMDEI